MSANKLLILGANSDIAKALAHQYAQAGYDLILSSRNSERLKDTAEDLRIRYEHSVELAELDILNTTYHQSFYDPFAGKLSGVICAIGYLGSQENAQNDANELALVTQSNYTAIAQFLEIVADDFSQQQNGFIIGISSVAGDRGRKSNYIYGAAKAAFTSYLSGLRNRLHEHGVLVLTVKPGFVNTSMTENMDLPKKLTAAPRDVAKAILKAQRKGRNIIYTKPIWFLIMAIIRNIPEFLFKKLSL